MDRAYLERFREDLLAPSTAADRFAWWEAKMRGSLQPVYAGVASLLLVSPDDQQLASCTPEFRAGFAHAVDAIRLKLEASLGMDLDGIVLALEDRHELEEALGRILAGEDKRQAP